MTSIDKPSADAETSTRELYQQLINAWNKRNARDYALAFASSGSLVGFDGSQVNGQMEIGAHVSEVFSHHQTATYVTIVREVRPIAGDVTVLRGNVGMIPPGNDDINPELNAIQCMVAVRKSGKWEVALFQNTPAAFHEKPELTKKLTEELRTILRQTPVRE
jgi:uncharacterized protein (TIGR02246 family)